MGIRSRLLVGLAFAVLCIGGGAVSGAQPAPSPAAFIAYGKRLMVETTTLMPSNVGGSLACASCHIDAGSGKLGFSLRGTYAAFPQWNARAKRYIEIQDRIVECFLYSMNGHPPSYASREMIAITAYIASLSKGIPVGTRSTRPEDGAAAGAKPGDRGRGGALFAQRCAMCHNANGQGTAAAPPLWGPKSFNTGAGLHRQDTLADFVRINMPLGFPPRTLSAQQAHDVAAFILGHPRPRFHGRAPVIFQPEPARFF